MLTQVRIRHGSPRNPVDFAVQPCGRRHESLRHVNKRSGCVDCATVIDALERKRRQNPVGADFRAWIFARDGNRCRACGSTEDLCVDHVVSLIRGGPTDPDNLQTLCRVCNSSKGPR